MPDNMRNIRSMLEGAVAKKRKQKEDEEFKSLTSDLVKEIAGSVSPDDVSNAIVDRLEKAISPVMERLMEKDRVTTEDITRAISEMQLRMPEINVPEMKMPEIRVPQPKVTVNVPKITVPDIIMPEEMNTRGWLGIMGYDKKLLSDPIPVQIRDAKGNPVDFGAQVISMSSSGGGKHDFFTIKGFSQSAFQEITNPDGRLKVELPSGSSGLTDTELRASSVPVAQASGANWSTEVTNAFATTASSTMVNGDNRLKVSVETGGSGLTDTELRATAVPVSQVSGAKWSTEATQAGTWDIGTVTTVTGVTNSVAAALVDSSGVQYSTTNPVPIDDAGGSITIDGTVAVSGITGTLGVNVVDSSGVAYSTTNPLPIGDAGGTITVDGTVVVSSITATVAAMNVDSTGVGYSGSNPVPVVLVANQSSSTVVVGDTLHDDADAGGAPVKIGGVAMATNPTAVADGDRVNFRADDIGRQITRPVQARDLIATAYVALTNGTETTLLAGTTNEFHDLIEVICANQSDAATYIELRASTGGTVTKMIEVPAYGTAGVSLSVPYPAPFAGHSWTVDMPDITGTTIGISGLFTREL